MKSFLFNFCVISVVLIGCSQQRFVVMPNFTDVAHIEKLKLGMSKSEVSTELEINPIDFYYLQEGVDVYVYNYRLMEKRISITNDYTHIKEGAPVLNDHIDGLASRAAGTPFYTEWRKLYVSFKGDKLTGMISDSGKDDANAVILQLASIQALQADPQVKLVPKAITDHNYVVPIDDKGNYIINSPIIANGVNQNVANSSGVAVIPNHETPRNMTEEVKVYKRGKKKNFFGMSKKTVVN